MTDEQYESLRKHILDLSVKVEELKLMLKQQNETADYRFSLLYEWCAPADYKRSAETEVSSRGQSLDAFLSSLGVKK